LPLFRLEGYVLKTQPLGDADKIVTFLTREEGKIRGVAKSARRSRRRFGSSLEPWSRVALSLFEKEATDLTRVESCDLLESSYRLQEDLETGFFLSYMAEVADLFSRDRQAEPHYYRLLGSVLGALRSGLSRATAQRYFEVWTLKLHGLLPDLARCSDCDEELSRGRFIFQPGSGSVLCPRCGASGGGLQVVLGEPGREVLGAVLRKHPLDLVAHPLSTAGLAEVGRMTAASLAAFVETPFRAARFLEVAEGRPS